MTSSINQQFRLCHLQDVFMLDSQDTLLFLPFVHYITLTLLHVSDCGCGFIALLFVGDGVITVMINSP